MSVTRSPRRIIVCGTPRSGTTLAQRCIVSSLDGAVTGPETHAYAVGASELLRQVVRWLRGGSKAGAAFYDAMWSQVADGTGDPTYLVEKTPNHLRWLPSFLEHDNELVAMVVEKPVDAATASLARAEYSQRPIAVAYAHVRFDRAVTSELRRSHPHRVGVVALADLADNEAGTVASVVRGWGLEPAEVPNDANAGLLVNDDEYWKAESLTPGDTRLVDRSLRALPAPLRSRLAALSHLHGAQLRASGRDVPTLSDTVLVLGRHAPVFLGQLALIRAKHLLVRRVLGRLFVGARAA